MHKNVEKSITQMEMGFGIAPNFRGFAYLRTAAEIISVKKNSTHLKITSLYAVVAELYNTTAVAVERAIRYSISAAWDKDIPYLHTIFKKKPTSAHFIMYIAERARLEANKNSF